MQRTTEVPDVLESIIEVRTDTAEFTDMRIAGLRKWCDLIREGKTFVGNKSMSLHTEYE